MIPYKNKNRGLVKMIVIILVILLVLAYFGFNIRSIVGSSTFQDNWAFLKNLLETLWDKVLKVPFEYVWNNVILPLIGKAIEGQKVSS